MLDDVPHVADLVAELDLLGGDGQGRRMLDLQLLALGLL
jgi:hypothetical protein